MTGPTLRLPLATTSTREARRFVAKVLAAAGIDTETVDSALLLTSELATNAILHARSGLTVAVTLSPEHLRIDVADENSRPPAPASLPVDALSGRGLQLVEAIAPKWGIEIHPHGKVVWFELPCSLVHE